MMKPIIRKIIVIMKTFLIGSLEVKKCQRINQPKHVKTLMIKTILKMYETMRTLLI